jgi:hypothetical protein
MIFLDEIGELPLTMQAKLLRVLQEKEVEPVGSAHPVPVNVRVLAASNRDLEEMVREKRFRLDLFYRLHVISLQIPPLRKRKEDIPDLAQILLRELSADLGIYASRITPGAMGCLLNYDWPGNVRELRNVLERSMHLMDGDTLDVKHLPYHLQKNQGCHDGKFSLKSAVARAEKEAIRQALKAANGNRNLAIGDHEYSLGSGVWKCDCRLAGVSVDYPCPVVDGRESPFFRGIVHQHSGRHHRVRIRRYEHCPRHHGAKVSGAGRKHRDGSRSVAPDRFHVGRRHGHIAP